MSNLSELCNAIPQVRHAGFILLVQDTAGRVCIEYAENARLRLRQLAQGGVDVDTHHIAHSVHARAIVETIRTQFRMRAIESAANWFLLDWGQLVTALEDYNLETGEIGRDGEMLFGTLVYVKALKEVGEVRSFRQEGARRLARVAFVRPVRTNNLDCIAAFFPTTELKVIVPQPGGVAA